MVYDERDKPTECPEPVTTTGWRSDWQGRWHVVDACAAHAHELSRRPRPIDAG